MPPLTQPQATGAVRLGEQIINGLDAVCQEPTRPSITHTMKI
jgi:hypothetical protein